MSPRQLNIWVSFSYSVTLAYKSSTIYLWYNFRTKRVERGTENTGNEKKKKIWSDLQRETIFNRNHSYNFATHNFVWIPTNIQFFKLGASQFNFVIQRTGINSSLVRSVVSVFKSFQHSLDTFRFQTSLWNETVNSLKTSGLIE